MAAFKIHKLTKNVLNTDRPVISVVKELSLACKVGIDQTAGTSKIVDNKMTIVYWGPIILRS